MGVRPIEPKWPRRLMPARREAEVVLDLTLSVEVTSASGLGVLSDTCRQVRLE
jgi:hypothetical protein